MITNEANSYWWGLFNTTTEKVDKSTLVYSTISGTLSSYNSIKSIFFHIGNKDVGTYKYKWIQKDENGISNIGIDSTYPVNIIAWKINGQANEVNLNYMNHLSQKINELQIGYTNLSKRIDAIAN